MTFHHRLYLLALLVLALPSLARSPSPNAGANADPQTIGLPYALSDNFGSHFDVQHDGSIGDGGNDLYDGGGRLFIDNQFQFTSSTGQAVFDPARQELQFPVMHNNGLNVSRRVAVMPALGALRFVEILENPTPTPRRVAIRVYFNLGGSVASATPLHRDGSRRNAHVPLGFAIQDRSNALAMVGGGAGAKVLPRFNFQQQSDNVDLFYDIDIPARQIAVIVHFQIRRPMSEEAAAVWRGTRDKDLLRDLPRELLNKLVNFRAGDGFVDDMEILRGEALDIIELRGGDSYRGTLTADSWRVQTLYGPITLPADKVVALINVGKYRTNQLLVTTQGEVVGGRLDTDTVEMSLSGGQTTRIPLSQITRLGYRRRPGDVDSADWSFENRPTAYLRGGQRLFVKLANPEFALATPIGPLKLSSQDISSIVFQTAESSIPTVTLRDGSRLSALLPAPDYEAALPGLADHDSPLTSDAPPPSLADAHNSRVRLPSAALARLTFAPQPDVESLASKLTLSNQDELIGTLKGTLTLHTAFDTVKVEGPQIKRLVLLSGSVSEVQVTLWDDSAFSGRLVETHLTCQLRCGLVMRAPVPLVREYHQPLPQPSDPIARRIRTIARELDSDQWSDRDRAHASILSIGPPAISVLKQLRPACAPEARQRIDLILQSLSTQLDSPGSSPRAGAIDADGDGIADNANANARLDGMFR